MNIVLYLFYPFLICATLGYVYKTTNIKDTIRKHWKLVLSFFLFNLLFLNIYAYFRLSAEDFIPFWDWAGYYKRTIEVMQLTEGNSLASIISTIYQSMLYDDYSYFAGTFLLLPLRLLGNSYSRYIMSAINFFIIPVNCLVFCLILHALKPNKHSLIIITLLITLFVSNLAATLYGYIGSVGMLFVLAVIILTFLKPYHKIDLFNDVIIGLLLLILVFIRRWYAYFVVAYFLCTLISELIAAHHDKQLKKTTLGAIFINLFIRGIIPSIIMFLGFMPLVVDYLTSDYSLAYAAYALSDQFTYVALFYNHFSPFIIWLAAFGLLYGLLKKQNIRINVFCITSVLTIFFLFTRVQQFDTHHYFLVNIMIMFLAAEGIIMLVGLFANQHIATILVVVISTLLVVNFYCCFEDNSINDNSLVTKVISSNNYPKRILEGKATVVDLVNYLRQVDKEYEYIYVLSTSSLLNDDMMMNALLPDTLNALDQLEATHVWDTRDGVPELFFKYTYIVVCDPVQFNSNQSQQKMFATLAEGMLYDEELRQYYEIVNTFEYTNNINIYVFKLVEDVSDEVITKYENIIKAYYPAYPQLCEFVH